MGALLPNYTLQIDQNSRQAYMQSSLCAVNDLGAPMSPNRARAPGLEDRAGAALHKQPAGAPQCRRAQAQPAARRATNSVVADKQETTRVSQHTTED